MINNLKKLGIILLFSTASFAQNFNATGLGLGNNFISYSQGVDAFGVNPANLAFNNRMEIKFFSPTIAISNSSISFSDYDRLFTKEGNHGEWNSNDKREIIDFFADDGLDINADVNLNVFSMAINNFGFGIDLIASGGINTKPVKLLRTALEEFDFTPDYTFSQPDFATGSFYSALKYSFSYAHLLKTKLRKFEIDNIAVAAKLNYYSGIAVFQVLNSDVLLERSNKKRKLFDEDLKQAKIKTRKAYPEGGISAGGGFGLDIAASAIYKDDWHFTLLLENLFASISWDVNTVEIDYAVSVPISFSGSSNDESDFSVDPDTTRKINSFSTPLPVNLIIGAHYQLLDKLTLTAQWKQGLSKDFGNVFTPQVGVGAEFRPLPWLPLRSGITVGGRDAFLLALGAGIDVDVFQFNLAYAMREALWPTFSNGAYFAFDFKFGF